MLVKSIKCPCRGFLGWVEESDIPTEHEVALVIFGAELLSRKLLGGHCQCAEAVVAEAFVLSL